MYAIVKTGGKQYRVERGQTLLVERLDATEGADVALEPILYRSEQPIFDKDGLGGVKVTAKVLEHVRGEKLRVFKFKPKRGYKRRTGHRQQLTRIEVTDISSGAAKPGAKRAAKPADADAATAAAPSTPKAKPPAPKAKPAAPKAKPGAPKAKPSAPKAKPAEAKAKAKPKAKASAAKAKPTSEKAKADDGS